MNVSYSVDVSFRFVSKVVVSGLVLLNHISDTISNAYFLWLITMPLLDLANSIPKKNYNFPKSFILNLSFKSFLF